MEIIRKQLSELTPYENNPRNNDKAVEAVASSIKEFGFKVPIVIDTKGNIIAGHTRLKAAQKLELAEVPVIVADDLTDEQVRAFRLADNKVGEIATWYTDILEEELSALKDSDIDLSSLGFDVELPETDENELTDDQFDEELPTVTDIQLGDMYQLGNHRLMCGDSTKQEDIDKLVGNATIDLLVTDPPYNINYEKKQNARNAWSKQEKNVKEEAMSIANDNMSDSDFIAFLTKAFATAEKHMKAGCAFYVWYASSMAIPFRQAILANGLLIKQELIWKKNTFSLSRQDYHWIHEPCIYGWKPGAAHYFIDDRTQTTFVNNEQSLKDAKKPELIQQIKELQNALDNAYGQTSIINEDKPQRNDIHPTMKPIPLIGKLIKNSSQVGETVMDIFGGSGSTLMACEQLDRHCVTMEYEPTYCQSIINRWESYTGNKATRILRVAQDDG